MESRTQPPANRTAAGAARRYAIASGKGGVGKTWFAISLAATLAGNGLEVLLVDGDLGLANVDVQLGLAPERDLAAIAEDGSALESAITHYAPGRFDVLAGRAGSGALSTLPASGLERLMRALSEPSRYDVVLLDLGAGVDRAVRRMTCWADTLIVLATEEPTSLTDAYVVMKLHLQDRRHLEGSDPRSSPDIGPNARPDIRIVVNQADTERSGEATFRTLSRVSAHHLGYEPTLGGVIRRDGRVRDAIRAQIPLRLRHPLSDAAVDLDRIGDALLRGDVRTCDDVET